MKPLRIRIDLARDQADTTWEVIERDYLISWIFAGIASTDTLRDTLVFKGGTALKKCYFGDYRFSEDLDFTSVDAPIGEELERELSKACAAAVELLDPYAPVDITCERYLEKQAHPGGQEAFVIRARFPWQRRHQTRVLVEVTTDEPLLWSTQTRELLHAYEEPIDTRVCVYALEEIVAEKLRAILQHARQLEERGWSRSRARDYYDLWRILGEYRGALDLSGFKDRLTGKCATRGVSFESPDDFFTPLVLDGVERSWTQWLGPLVRELPAYETVMSALKPGVAEMLA